MRAFVVAIVAAWLPVGASGAEINVEAGFDLSVDCSSPFPVTDRRVRADVTATMRTDRTASADLKLTGTLNAGVVHFDALLGKGFQPAPGGMSRLQVMGPRRLRATWDLPKSQLILNISVAARGDCTARLAINKKPDADAYSLYDGAFMYTCSAARVLSTQCEAH